MCCLRSLYPALLSLFASSLAFGQAVISTHSGVINYLEGTVFLDGQPVEQKAGSFPSLKDGSTLRTEDGRAEVLLTPGVFLRIDEQSGVRMISSALSDTRVELLNGSAIVDSKDAAKTDSLVLIYQKYEVRFVERGVFRLNSEPGILQAYTGTAKITASGRPPSTIDDAHQFFFDIGLQTEKIGEGTADLFSEWARNRSDAIAAENTSVADNSADPGDQNADPSVLAGGGFPLGLPSYTSPVGPVTPVTPLYLGSSFYNPVNPYFNAPLGYPLIGVFAIPRPIRRPVRPGYPTLLGTGRRPYPVPVHPVRPIYPFPIRSGSSTIPMRTGLMPSGAGGMHRPIGVHPVIPPMRPVQPMHVAPSAPAHVMPAHPSMGHAMGGHR